MEFYWFNELVIVFIVVVYYKDDNKDFKYFLYVFILDELFYDKRSVYVFNKVFLDVVSREMFFKQVYYWSDGVGFQFKNRFNLVCVLYYFFDY